MLLLIRLRHRALVAKLGLLASVAFLAYGLATGNHITMIMGAVTIPISLGHAARGARITPA
jgi:hypothetical protein